MDKRVFQSVPLYISLFLPLTVIHLESVHAKTIPSLCKIKYPSDVYVEWECRRLLKGETLEGLFGDKWKDVVRFNRIDRRHVYHGTSIKVPKRLEDIEKFAPLPLYYQPAETETKFILVDLTEQFLGAYEYGHLVFSIPITTGNRNNKTPTGEFKITVTHSRHESSLYLIEKTNKPYPMSYGLMFHVDGNGVAFWIHGRDLPGHPASHGCIGLYDERMQKIFYGFPHEPVLEDAKILFNWVISPLVDDGKYRVLKDGPKILIIDDTHSDISRSHPMYKADKDNK